MEVEKQVKALSASYAKGTAHFREQNAQQNEAREALRKNIKEAIVASVANRTPPVLDELQQFHVAEIVSYLDSGRDSLMDGKTFLSDRDAAVLGRAVAMSVVQFRFGLERVTVAFSTLLKVAAIDGKQAGETLAGLMDQIVVNGEDALIAMVRLETHVDRISKRTALELTWDVLRGR